MGMGATPTTAMTHIAIQEHLDEKVVDWMEKVATSSTVNTGKFLHSRPAHRWHALHAGADGDLTCPREGGENGNREWKFCRESCVCDRSGSGIGRAAALAFAREGATVVVADSQGSQETARMIEGGRALA